MNNWLKFKNGVVVSVLVLLSQYSFANEYTATGKVHTIRSHIGSIYTDWFAVEGFSSAGSCRNTTNGLIPILFEDSERAKRQFSIVMSAFMSGREVSVAVDDDFDDQNGYCKLTYLTVDQ